MKTKHWIIAIVVVLILLYRKRLAAWLLAEDNDSSASKRSASVNTPLANLISDTKKKGKSVAEVVLQMADNMLDAKQELYAPDLMDGQPIAQKIVSEGDFIRTVYPMEDKVFANTKPRHGIKIKQDQGWWPYLMYSKRPLYPQSSI